MPSATVPLLRRACADDAAAYARIMGDAAVFPSTMQLPFVSEAVWRKRIEESSVPGHRDLLLVAELGGRVVGSASLHPQPQQRRQHVALLGISVALEGQGRGVGTALMQALCGQADGWAQILRIELTVFSDNARAIGLYQRFGFRHEGTHRAYAMRDGRYADALTMARLHPSPPSLAWAN